MALGFSFKELPALHCVLALSSLVIGQCALNDVMTFGILSGKTLLIPDKGICPAR
jgi:hypothetical protein